MSDALTVSVRPRRGNEFILHDLNSGKKNLTYGHFWGTNGRPFDREGGVVRSRRGFYIGFKGAFINYHQGGVANKW